ncbi:hypothetical protein AD998_11455 [bacterium 336/3]|nr:hypothetical protein AD998_11455 [bacterium 336/3]
MYNHLEKECFIQKKTTIHFFILTQIPFYVPMKKLYLSIILCYLSLALMAQNYRLELQSGNQPSKIAVEQFSAQKQAFTQARFGAGTYVILQFHQIPNENAKALIQSKGVTLLNYLPNYAFWAYLPDNVNSETLKSIGVKDVYPYQGEDKVSMLFKGKKKPMWAIKENGKYDVYIQLYNNISVEQAKNLLKNYSWIKIINEKAMPNTMELRIPIDKLNELAQIPVVFYLEPTNPEPYLENRESTSNHRINFMNSEYAAGRKYDGTGVVVSMGDDGTADSHMDKKGRITNNLSSNSGDHGDHVSGIIMGAGNVNPLMKGQASGAQLEVYSGHADIDGMPAPYNDKGVKITSHSLGETLNAGYTSGAVNVDQQIRQFPDLMHVFSSGNSGSGFFTITGGRKAGKNVMAIGNLTKTDVIASSSSRGPSADGRLKPEICAVGTSVLSTGENNTYYSSTGTSMACPAISGTLAVMYHAYKSLNSNNNPTSALIKAILMNTADDLGNANPDYIYGYGRVNARRAVLTLEGNRYFESSISQGGANTHTINVPAGTKQLKVMVYWNDYEGTSASSNPLVNNLNMTITTPASTTVQPWILDSANPSSLATRGTDNKNNSEQITIDDPATGNHTVNIAGTTIPQGPQNYVVVYEFVRDEVVVIFPLGGESFHPSESEVIRWDAWGTDGNFTLEYSTNNGTNWTNITTVAGSARSFTWAVPNTPSGQALVRVTKGALNSQSIANFSIQAPPTGLTLVGACNGVSVSWTASAGATGYEVFRLGAKYMESVGTTTSTSLIDPVATGNTYWYAVRALGTNNSKSRRTIAQSFTYTTVACATDASISNITPKGNVCTLTSSTNIQVTVSNTGTSALNNLTVNYTVKKADNSVVHTGSANIASLNPSATQNVSFTADLSKINENYTIEATVTAAGDGNAANNTLSSTAFNAGVNVTITQDGSRIVATPGYRNYRWFLNGTLLASTGTTNELTISQMGTYTVEAQSTASTCKSTSANFVVTVLALEDVSEQLGLFPNPTTDKLQVNLPKEFYGNNVLELTDVSGRKVYQKTIQDGLKQSIDLNNLPKGIYILEIRNEKYKAIKKVIKQ